MAGGIHDLTVFVNNQELPRIPITVAEPASAAHTLVSGAPLLHISAGMRHTVRLTAFDASNMPAAVPLDLGHVEVPFYIYTNID